MELADLTAQHVTIARGLDYMRYLSLLFETGGRSTTAAHIFAQRYPRSLNHALVEKAATAAGTTTDSTWAGPLAAPQPLAEGFLAYVRPLTIIGRLPLRKVPFNVTVSSQTGAGVYSWIAEAGLKKVTKAAYSSITVGVTKCAGIITVTEELLRFSQPNAETVLRDEIASGLAQLVDTTFTDPALAPGGGSPGSITNGVTPIAPTGTTEAALAKDVATLVSQFLTNNPDPTRARLVMRPDHAAMLQHATNSQTLTVDGGSHYGIPVVVSATVGTRILALDAGAILLADHGVEIDLSRQATIELDDAPSGSAASVVTSLWQTNLVGLRGDWLITWKKARATAVSVISPTAYVPGT